jgi:hypothetical protein
MPNRNQRAGGDWEETCARDARESGGFLHAERTRVKHPDRGDIGHVDGWTIECKSPGPPAIHTPDAAWGKWARAHGIAVSTTADAFLAGYLAGQKDTPRFDLAAAMDQVAKARAETGTPWGVVLRKRPRSVSARGYAIMEASQFWAIARRLADAGAPAAAP